MKQTLYIDSTVFYQMLGDPAFYDAVPASLEPLRAEGEAAYTEALKVAMGKASCLGCTSIHKVLTPVMSAYGKALSLIQKEAPTLLEALRNYLAKKRGYRAASVVMYYRGSDGRTETLSI